LANTVLGRERVLEPQKKDQSLGSRREKRVTGGKGKKEIA